MVLLSILLFFSSIFGVGIWLGGSASGSARGDMYLLEEWIPLLYRCSDPQLLALAREAGYEEVSLLSTQMVEVFDFSGMETVPLVSLSDRYDDLDPLYDPYLRTLPRFFQGSLNGEELPVAYLRTDNPPSMVREQFEAVLTEPGMIHLPGTGDRVRFLLFPFFLVLMMLRLPWKKGRSLFIYLPGNLPLLLVSLAGTPSSLPALFLFPFLWRKGVDLFMNFYTERFYRFHRAEAQIRLLKWYTLRYGAFMALSLLVFLIGAGGAGGGLALGLGLLSPWTVVLAVWAFGSLRRGSRQHRKFIPLPLQPGQPATGGYISLILLSGFTLMFAILPITGKGEVSEVRIPLPLVEESPVASGLFQADVLVQADAEDQLPGGADYIAHRAFHEGYLFGMEYRLPRKGETLSYDHFSYIDGELYSEQLTVKQFTEQWYGDIIPAQMEDGIESLLVQGGDPVSFRYAEVEENPDHNRTLPNRLLLILAVLFLFVLSEAEPRPGMFTRVASIRMTRSKEQAA